MTTSPRRLSIGIIGTARIARSFVAALRESTAATVVAVASRSAAQASAFASEFAIPRSYGGYELLLRDDHVDTLYIPLPNSLHAEWAIRAAEAGKHVLCEKPLAASAEEARAMFAAAARNRVVLMEAYPYLSQPQTLKLFDLVRAGTIGEVRLIRASFGFTIKDPGNIRMDAALAGGSLMDAGSYPVSLAIMVQGQRPIRVHAAARWAPSGVDSSMLGTLEFPSGAMAQISCSFETGVHRQALIAGTDGVIETTYQKHLLTAEQAVIRLRRGTDWTAPVEDIHVAPGNGFAAETIAFRDLVVAGPQRVRAITPADSIAIAETLDALRASAKSGRWEPL